MNIRGRKSLNLYPMSSTKYILVEVLFPLFLAGCIYLLFRPEGTVVYRLTEALGFIELVDVFRLRYSPSGLPEWFVYSLPGGLWLLAFQNILTWANKFKGKRLVFFVFSALLIGVGLEVAQAFHFTDGRFDWIDLLFYVGATVVAFSNVWLVQKKWQLYTESAVSSRLMGGVFVLFTVIIYLADII